MRFWHVFANMSSEGSGEPTHPPNLARAVASRTHKVVRISGVTIYVIAWMLYTRSITTSSVYKISFSLPKFLQIGVYQN